MLYSIRLFVGKDGKSFIEAADEGRRSAMSLFIKLLITVSYPIFNLAVDKISLLACKNLRPQNTFISNII